MRPAVWHCIETSAELEYARTQAIGWSGGQFSPWIPLILKKGPAPVEFVFYRSIELTVGIGRVIRGAHQSASANVT
jgi:hypothetical protein